VNESIAKPTFIQHRHLRYPAEASPGAQLIFAIITSVHSALAIQILSAVVEIFKISGNTSLSFNLGISGYFAQI
jgi:hypothetical protein